MNELSSLKPAPARPRVSVIVPCRNEAANVASCVSGLLGLYPPKGGFELVVADGMSTDGTREILARLEKDARGNHSVLPNPIVRVIDNSGQMTPCGLNAAIRAANGDIIVRADAHSTYAPDYLLRCLETLRETGADNVGGPARTKADGYMERAVAAAYHSPFSVGGARFHNVEYEGRVDTVTYGCWRRETFEKYGYFDEELVRNQDDEHNLRIVRGGGKVWQNPEIKSWYRPRGSLTALFKQYMQYGYWKVRVIQKHRMPASWRHVVPGAFILALLSSLLLSGFGFLVSHFSHASLQPSAFSFFGATSVFFLYALCVLVASVNAAAKTEWKLLPVLPAVFGCYHFGYGWGFVCGVWDFVIRRRDSAPRLFAELTRSSPEVRSKGQMGQRLS